MHRGVESSILSSSTKIGSQLLKICIVGGGTAGWLASFFISKSQPGNHKITVIESSSIGVIGTGEASTGIFVDLLKGGFFNKPYRINIDEFMKATDSTIKMGIKHTNWAKTPGSYFAPIDISPTAKHTNDYIFKYVLAKYGVNKIHIASKMGIEYELESYKTPYALHFDGQKVGKFFRNICVKEDAVDLIDAVVTDISLKENGDIASLLLNNGSRVEADLFIDCTGFARILMKKLGVKWISYKKWLPVDTAMPFFVQYEGKEKTLPQIDAYAMNSGWMWSTPLTTRRGCGYVYDSSFLTKEQAIDEVQKFIGKEITPIKFINFENGSSEYYWKNNVLALGLSSSFMEPLEATSIHNTILQLIYFVLEFLSKDVESTFNPAAQSVYNSRMTKLNSLTADFISIHYQGGREDTEFWRWIKNDGVVSDTAKQYVEMLPYKIPGFPLLDGMWGSYSLPLANWIFAGIGLAKPEVALKELQELGIYEHAAEQFEIFYQGVSQTVPYQRI